MAICEPVGTLQQAAHPQGDFITGLGAMAQAVAVEGHQPGFGTGKEGGTADEQNQGNEQHPYMDIVQVTKTSV